MLDGEAVSSAWSGCGSRRLISTRAFPGLYWVKFFRPESVDYFSEEKLPALADL